ncbi:hypothetical protein HPP92_019439 [Vanilla planifolia]|uniref:Protein kinase domain-containing protein n=1 Tax=Vanilla planifolia TaxID=51239 RepID=A0A835Q2V8_VANPL|nr:hypothetical protein HPP92_019439 [Vanilla planifolia]
MQDLFGSVRRSLALRANPVGNEDGVGSRIAEKIGSCLRKSRVGLGLGLGFPHKLSTALSSPPRRGDQGRGTFNPVEEGGAHWLRCLRTGLHGDESRFRGAARCEAGFVLHFPKLFHFRCLQIYYCPTLYSTNKKFLILMGLEQKPKFDSFLILPPACKKAHVRELEEEVKLLKNLTHPNIVRYLGTAREEDTLNILLEFVPGGSISSLLGKFGSFPEPVIKMYTKQLLQGLEYLHKNGIIHRDIKGANILVDNKGCIKLADFGASKQVVKLATMTAAKSMKGTPYWMAPSDPSSGA